jgi:hypothetical protein
MKIRYLAEREVQELNSKVQPLLEAVLRMAHGEDSYDTQTMADYLRQALRHIRQVMQWSYEPAVRDTNTSRVAIKLALLPAAAKVSAAAKIYATPTDKLDLVDKQEWVYRVLAEAQMDIAEVAASPEFQPGYIGRTYGDNPNAD